MMKIVKNDKGFTLVEVIVVAVIVAVLAAVAIPLYLGYVEDSRVNVAANASGSVASFCGACQNSGGTLSPADGAVTGTLNCAGTGISATSIQIPSDVTVTINATAKTVSAKHTKSPAATLAKVYNY